MEKLNPHIKDVCKIGQGALCCKYLVMAPAGFECSKVIPGQKEMIDIQWALHDHVSQGDNCDGVADFKKLKENAVQ